MTKISRRKSYKRGGECNRNCTIRPGCSGKNRHYNPNSGTCEYDFSGAHKMLSKKDWNSMMVEDEILRRNPMLIKLRNGYIPVNAETDTERFGDYITESGVKSGGKGKKKRRRSRSRKSRKSLRKYSKMH